MLSGGETSSPAGTCSDCEAALETPLACASCGAVHPLPDVRDPFALLGLPHAFELNSRDLRQRLVRFSRLVHPDFFGSAEAATRERAERNSAALNEAFGVLSDDSRRADLLLRLCGGPDENAEREMPQEFLLEVMEWNERLEEARESPGPDTRQDLSRLHIALQAERESLFGAIAAAFEADAADGGALADVRRKLNAVRYLDRALGQIEALRLDLASAH